MIDRLLAMQRAIESKSRAQTILDTFNSFMGLRTHAEFTHIFEANFP